VKTGLTVEENVVSVQEVAIDDVALGDLHADTLLRAA
jgi:hypothetical protein